MDDWERKYWEKKQQQIQQGQQRPRNPQDLPHFEPAHVTQDRQRAHNAGNGWKEIDPLTSMYTNMDGMTSRGMGPQSKMVMVREGTLVYKAVQADGFGTTMPMVRSMGPAVGMVGKEFEMRGVTHCYLIDNLEVVDLSDINPQKMLHLVEVRAPFVGTLLVEKSAIIVPRGQGGPQVLND